MCLFFNHLRLNSANVLADYTPDSKCPKSFYQETFQGKLNSNSHQAAGKIASEHPNRVSFIYQNPRLVNEPICFANTRETCREQQNWLYDSVSPEKKLIPKFNTATVNRSDYKAVEEKERPKGLSRFGCNTNRTNVAKGMVPGHCVEESVIAKERISYGHQFDCRQSRKERGRLHGAFVWEPVTDSQLYEKIKERLINNKTYIY